MWQKLNAVKAISFYKAGHTCPSVQAGITQKLKKKLKFLYSHGLHELTRIIIRENLWNPWQNFLF
jgi:hypothetical protein